MIEFSKQIVEKWNVSSAVAEYICSSFEKGDTPYYLAEYRPDIAVEVSHAMLWEIFDFLGEMKELIAKRKRVLNALKKAERSSPAVERRINLCTNGFELDDLLLPLRPNPRSRGQLAAKKGLEPLADLLIRQEEQDVPFETVAEKYVGKDPTLGSVTDVIAGVKDVVAERFAYDDTVRAMAREFAYDDGSFEVTPKNRQDPYLSRFVGKMLPIPQLSREDSLALIAADNDKTARVKLSVQLFRITELLRHHFIQNPDFSGFDLLCEIIDDCWNRLLQPIIERDVKLRLQKEVEDWAAAKIAPELEKKYRDEDARGTHLIVDASSARVINFIAMNGHGELIAATSEKKAGDGKSIPLERLRQFFLRHRPAAVVIAGNEQVALAESVARQMAGTETDPATAPAFVTFSPEGASLNPGESDWIKKKYEHLLDADMRRVYGLGLLFLQPSMQLPRIGLHYYSVHPFQRIVSQERFLRILDRIVTIASLRRGVLIKDIVDSPLATISSATPENLQAIRAADVKEPFSSKNDVLKVPGMTEVLFRNIAGFIIIVQSEDPRDRSLVHPDHYQWLEEASEQLNVSIDTLMSEPEVLRSLAIEDFVQKAFVEKNLLDHIRVSARFAPTTSLKQKKKYKLNELKEGAIVSGRVTNITPFGVFVNINAVCDGLIHISQLADEYVESPEQVVALHDKVDVRILKVDIKKRRISLSMKNLGKPGPRVKPTQGQLNTLAEHFNKR